jgi:Protein of unknown function (DUF1572)
MLTEEYIPMIVRELKGQKVLADRAIAQLPPDGLFAVPGEEDNSIAVILKHVSGNMRSRWKDFLATDGEKPNRNRDGEFTLLPEDTAEALLARWEEGWTILFGTLQTLGTRDLGRLVTIRGEQMTVLQAINRQLTHYSYHVGQVVYVAKHLAGDRWRSLSIPKNASASFNRAPRRYLG